MAARVWSAAGRSSLFIFLKRTLNFPVISISTLKALHILHVAAWQLGIALWGRTVPAAWVMPEAEVQTGAKPSQVQPECAVTWEQADGSQGTEGGVRGVFSEKSTI